MFYLSKSSLKKDNCMIRNKTNFSAPLQKERKLLQTKRLDLDAAKTKLKKAKMADARALVSYYCFYKS